MARLRKLGFPCPLCGRELTSWDDRASRALGYLTYQVCEMCLCKEYDKTQTELPYTYEGSLDEAHDRVWAESEELWKIFHAKHKGRVCKRHCYYDRTAKEWHTRYDPIACADGDGRACRYCPVLGKELDTRRGNVFYDVKETYIIKGDWLFPDKEVTTLRKGVKVLNRTASLTLCEAIVQYAKHHVISGFMLNHHLRWDTALRSPRSILSCIQRKQGVF